MRRSLALALLAAPAAAQQVGPPVQTNLGSGAGYTNETSIAVSENNPLEIVAGWNDYRTLQSARTGIGLSLDGGATWSDFLLRPPPPNQAPDSSTEGDPMVCSDPRTGAMWAGGIAFSGNGGVFVARRDPGAAGFQPSVMARVTSSADKGWMAAGAAPGDPSATRVYIAYNEGLLVSADMGATWSAPIGLDFGLGFLPRVGPNGELYVGYWDFGSEVKLLRSLDGGQTFQGPFTIAQRMDVWGVDDSRVPGDARVVSLLGLAVDPSDGTLYCVYPDSTALLSNGFDVDVYFTRSVDGGTTWSTPVVINGDAAPLPGDQVFPWIEVDAAGRLHVVYYDSRSVVQNDTDSTGFFDTTYATSDDGGATWTETVLSAQPLSTQLAFPGGVFIGDYLGLATGGGRTLPCYMDTALGESDVFVNDITYGPATTVCASAQCPCPGQERPGLGCASSFGAGGRLRASGAASVTGDSLVLAADGLPPTAPALYFQGTALENGGQGSPFGDGVRCVSGFVTRLVTKTSAGGVSSFPAPGDPSVSAAGSVPAGGGERFYQVWYRNSASFCTPATFNFTNALSVPWAP